MMGYGYGNMMGLTGFFAVVTWLVLFGVAALPLVIAGLITGNKLTLYVLSGDMLLLWALSTVRHALGT